MGFFSSIGNFFTGPVGGTLLGGLNIGGGIASAYQQAAAQRDANATNIQIARENNAWSAEQAQKEMDFQERMSESSVQRMAIDMKAAGINPMLAAGAGESTPSGAMGSVSSPRVDAVPTNMFPNIMSSAKDALSLGMALRANQAQYENMSADTTSKIANAAKIIADTKAVGASTTATQLSNVVKQRQLDIEQRHPKLFGWLDTIMSRLPLFHSASSAFNSESVS